MNSWQVALPGKVTWVWSNSSVIACHIKFITVACWADPSCRFPEPSFGWSIFFGYFMPS